MMLGEKHAALRSELRRLDRILIAFSGGIDSALLLRVAADVLATRVLAVTTDSASVPRRELREAANFARRLGVEHVFLETGELDNPAYTKNSERRCYFCKSELYTHLVKLARRRHIPYIANGTNADDLLDYRPGLQAAEEFRIVSPLQTARLTKEEIRRLGRQLGLSFWDKPASPCLASRIPYGRTVTREKLVMVETAEEFIRQLGVRELRVRHFGEKALLETHPCDFQLIEKNFDAVRARFEEIGFAEVAWRPFRSGALNAAILAKAQNEVVS